MTNDERAGLQPDVGASQRPDPDRPGPGSAAASWLVWVVVALGAALAVVAALEGIAWIAVVVVVWAGLLVFRARLIVLLGGSAVVFLVVIVVVWVLGLGSLLIVPGGGDDPSGGGAAGDGAKYDGTVLTVASQSPGLTGQVALTEAAGGKISAAFVLLFDTSLPVNGKCLDPLGKTYQPCQGVSYDYAVDLVIPGRSDSEGTLSIAYCHFGELPADVAEAGTYYSRETCGVAPTDSTKATTHFVTTFSRTFDSYADLMAVKALDLYDAADFWTITSDDGNGNIEGARDDDAAVLNGTKVAGWSVAFEE